MKKNKQSLLWKVSAKELAGDAYIFGTMHVKDQRAFQNQELVHNAINACDTFATEFNLDEAQTLMTPDFIYIPENQKISKLIPEKKYNKLRKHLLKCTGLDILMVDRFKPLLITNMLAEKVLATDMPFALDQALWTYAKEQSKTMLGIETQEEQIAVLAKISIDEQLKGLLSIGINFKRFRKQLLNMTALYEQQDIQQLYKSAKKSAKGLKKRLVYNRNVIMADRIADLAKQQSICCAIGAGHLAGKNGVLRLLKLKGFKVTSCRN